MGSTETSHEGIDVSEKMHLVVNQPEKIATLLDTLNLIETISERIGEDRSGDMGSAGMPGAQAGGAQVRGPSPRDQAIASLPEAAVMQERLAGAIRKEVSSLQKQIRSIPHPRQPGAANKLNALYARIRRLNGLLAEIFEASYEVLRRLFIRVFIDRQAILQ